VKRKIMCRHNEKVENEYVLRSIARCSWQLPLHWHCHPQRETISILALGEWLGEGLGGCLEEVQKIPKT
jgi:hypothetical protein